MLTAKQFDEADKFSAEIIGRVSCPLKNNPNILFWRGRCLIYLGNKVNGLIYFRNALRLDPDFEQCQILRKHYKNPEFLKDQAKVKQEAGDYAAAIEKFKECEAIDKLNVHFNADLLYSVALAYEKLNNQEQKLESLNQALKYDPKYSKSLELRGDHFAAQDDYREALSDYAQVAEPCGRL